MFISVARGADFALKFDGVNDFVTFGQAPGLGASNFTLEVWFMRQGVGITTNTGNGGITAVPLLTKGRAESDGDTRDMNYFLGIGTNNVLTADFERFVGGANQPVSGVTPIVNDVWYHAAVTYDGTNWAMYLNGSLETNLNVGAGVLPRYDSAQRAGLATTMATNGVAAGFFAGTLDEARIWGYARSQQEIRDTIRTAITNATTGLLGRWGLDESGGTIASNTAVPAITGILSNGPTRVAGYPFALAGTGGLYFDGVNDYVTFGPTNALGLSTFTLETWFKRTGTGIVASTGTGGLTAIPLVTKGRGEAENSNVDMNYFLGITTNNNRLCVDFEQFGGGTNWPVVGVTTIANDVWYHAAATYDGSSWSLYLNGVLETNVFIGQTPRSDSIQHAALGAALTSLGAPQGAFQGVLDEVRIWNYARTAPQVLSNMNYAISSETGLVAHWGLDEEWGIVATNSGTSLVHGTLTNGPTWVAGYPLAPAGVGGLFFDGDNDYVTFGPTNALGLATFTIETWFRRLGRGKAANTGAGGLGAIPLVAKGRNETDGSNVDMNYFFGITTNDNKLCADFEQFGNGTNWPVVGVTTITNGGWYHAAATYDGNSWSLYLNGVLETNVVVGETPRYDSIQHAALGAALNSSGVPNGAFYGILDEVRIWNYARSGSEVLSNMNYAIPSATGLVGRWGLDETSGLVASNSGSSAVHGTLTSGPAWSTGNPLLTSVPPSEVASVGVTNVTPNCGPTTGGTAVTITGSNFLDGATVMIGDIATTNVVVVSDSEITAVTPTNSAGAVIVSVTNTNGSFGDLTNGFTYVTDLSFTGLDIVTPATESATLSWSAGAGAVSYSIFQATTSGAEDFNTPVLVTNSLSTFISPLYPGSNSPLTYFFVVRATDACGNGETNTVEQSVQPLLDPNNDQDGDGMPNAFEQAHGLDPFDAADAGIDSDGDGMSNLQESLTGTDPTDSASAFRITNIVRANDDVVVSWMTGIGRTNALQWTAGSGNGNYNTNGFADLFTVTNAVGGITNYPDAGGATNLPARYYRIRLVP